MKKIFYFSAKLESEKGVTAIIVALLIIVFLGVAAFAIDMGFLYLARNQCQNAADAAARAGARKLSANYNDPSHPDPITSNVENTAILTAQANKVQGQENTVANVGTWSVQEGETSPRFVTNLNWWNAVRATTSTTFNSFFARILGVSTMSTSATATAVLFGPCDIEATVPLGISTGWFTLNPSGMCNSPTTLRFGDTNNSCIGWTNFDPRKTDHVNIESMCMLVNMIQAVNPSYPNPTVCKGARDVNIGDVAGGTDVNDQSAFTGGQADVMVYFRDAWSTLKDASGVWTVQALLYQGGCENPNKTKLVVGNVTIHVSNVIPTGNEKGIYGTVECLSNTPGACINAGTFASSSRLVSN